MSAGRWTSLHCNLALAIALGAFAVNAEAHTPDTSYCKIAIASDAVTFSTTTSSAKISLSSFSAS